jgi:SAM-dependent methyltransferase
VKVTAVEIEPQMAEVAARYFDLDKQIDVRVADARSFLRHDTARYDLVFLDTFASESTPWHMLTAEAMQEMHDRLNPGGRMIMNTVAYAGGENDGLQRVEATMLSVFPQVMVYPGRPVSKDPRELINVTLVAGESLDARKTLPATEPSISMLDELLADARPATKSAPVMTDERSDLDYVMAPLRIRWRTLIWDALDSDVLWD